MLATMILAATAALTAADHHGEGADPNKLTPEEKKAGWISLFDGKSLKGWNDPAKKSPPGQAWEVKDGAIHAVPKPNLREDLISDKKFRDFELVWQWKLDKGSNSGLKYRVQDRFFLDKAKFKKGVSFEEGVGHELANHLSSRSKPSAEGGEEYTVAFEYQMIDDDVHRDAMRGALYQTGAIYSMIPASKKVAKPIGEWNTSKVVLKGEHVEHWLNGEKLVDAMLNSEPILAASAKRWQKHAPSLYKLLVEQPVKECPIDLQHHNDSVWFRAIKIRKL
jgi:hypothetical protein